ncbi:uncharacterized protein LOC110242206 [Exaiptasia diaphana]|uniref:Aromatic amino acid beta-eliminating lyase/threonine aldolase domain-containing protein n=1 Tax=Exaiptasia diaphana TaxID=2652724 RepID=A0A913XG04_EXADI|nr:uncharacterized protein LOC110242206 [Exaiptasia diaphana]XP_020903818.1 uncharacterized protein LOC110242206 [Exaiptasia diaphana]KXJ12434.1 Tryptophanase [Exaiptasia diaphana]
MEQEISCNFEPFRIKSIETIKTTTKEERKQYLEDAFYNPFLIKSENVMIDLLTDSGTGAMSSDQWAAIMRGDESYAGSSSYHKLEKVIKEIYGYRHVMPTHQGRAAERILFKCAVKSGQIIPNNAHFDTTRANIEALGAFAVNLPTPEAMDNTSEHPFKGNLCVEKLEKLLSGDQGNKVPLVMLTITNNALGGSAVSMENIRAISKVCRSHNVPLFFDACRFAENAWFIKTKEPGYKDKTPKEISQEIFSYGDGCTMSAKKNGLTNIGGFLAMNDGDLAEKCRSELVISEGFVTYGGLAGRDLEAMAVGLQEILQEPYLEYQIEFVKRFADMLIKAGVPVLTPPGGHAVYIDAEEMLPHIPKPMLPAWSLCCALYIEGGIRGVEIGEVMFGGSVRLPPNFNKNADIDNGDDNEDPELVRLAIPRRVYTESHMRYVADVLAKIVKNKQNLVGYTIVWAPKALRHFSAHLAPFSADRIQQKSRPAFGKKVSTGCIPFQSRRRRSSVID